LVHSFLDSEDRILVVDRDQGAAANVRVKRTAGSSYEGVVRLCRGQRGSQNQRPDRKPTSCTSFQRSPIFSLPTTAKGLPKHIEARLMPKDPASCPIPCLARL